MYGVDVCPFAFERPAVSLIFVAVAKKGFLIEVIKGWKEIRKPVVITGFSNQTLDEHESDSIQ